jgi:hypothetical protein
VAGKQGLNILLRYGDSSVSTDHDIIYAGKKPPAEMEQTDVERLEALGWSWSDSFDCWRHFT